MSRYTSTVTAFSNLSHTSTIHPSFPTCPLFPHALSIRWYTRLMTMPTANDSATSVTTSE